MNVTDRVANLLIGGRGNAYCDDCIAHQTLPLIAGNTFRKSPPAPLPISHLFGGASACAPYAAV